MEKILSELQATIDHLKVLKSNAKSKDEKIGYTSAILLLELLHMDYV